MPLSASKLRGEEKATIERSNSFVTGNRRIVQRSPRVQPAMKAPAGGVLDHTLNSQDKDWPTLVKVWLDTCCNLAINLRKLHLMRIKGQATP